MSNRTSARGSTARIATSAALIGGLVVVLVSPPAHAQQAMGAVEIVKVVEGDAPAGSFEIELVCDTDGTITLTFDGEGSQTVPLEADTQDCEVNETEDLGALSVTYDCEDVVAPVDPLDQGCQPPGPGGNFFQVFDNGQLVRITVTNTFQSTPTSPTTSTSTTAATAPAELARPRFTG